MDVSRVASDYRSPSQRQLEVLRLIAGGLTNKEIAYELRVSEPAVKKHVRLLLLRYDASNRAELVAIALRGGVL